MGIETKFKTEGQKKQSEFCKSEWKEGGPLRNAHAAAAREVAELFKNKFSIGEIRAKLGYTKNGRVAQYLRKAGFKIPYANQLSRTDAFPTRKSIDPFYENLTIQDLEA
ncbi:hypothetical protein KY333_04240 [Candidatus Woesearchaeota archaeon]|nr:hypothetical protein [Candidatus Woesearchaeota archaeon]